MTAGMTEQLAKRAEQLPGDARRIADVALDLGATGILVCDRNARPIGYALEQLAERGGAVLPPLWYARVSTRIGLPTVADWINAEIERHPGAAGETVIVVDDHISNGGTKLLARRALAIAMPDTSMHFLTLTGKGGDTTLYPAIGSAIGAPWKDRADVIGYDYNDDGSVREEPTGLSEQFYARIRSATC